MDPVLDACVKELIMDPVLDVACESLSWTQSLMWRVRAYRGPSLYVACEILSWTQSLMWCVREPFVDPVLDVCAREPIMDPWVLDVCVGEPIMDLVLDVCVREPIMHPRPDQRGRVLEGQTALQRGGDLSV